MHRRTLLFSTLAASLTGRAKAWSVAAAEAPVALQAGALLHHLNVAGEDSVDLDVVTFDSRACTLRIIDEPSEATARGLAGALSAAGALAGTNGGFFSPQFQPLGLYVVDGRRSGAFTRSSLLGGVLLVRQGRLSLVWRDEYKDAPGTTQLMQTGPRLVSAGKPIAGLDTKASRPRSFIATDGRGLWALGMAKYCSLHQLAQILSSPGILPGMAVSRALNFDGGRSTGMWAMRADGEQFYEPPVVTVRNYVAVMRRD